MGDVSVRSADLYLLLVSHIPYAMGRRTYIVADVRGQVVRYAPALTSDQRSVLVRDLREGLEREERWAGQMGDPQDVRTWRETLALLEAMNK